MVAVTQLEQLTDLLGGYSHEVAERDHGPLGGRQGFHGLEQVLAQLGREQAGLGVAVEPGRGARPAAVGTERRRLTVGPSSLSSTENGTLRASRTA